MRYTFDIKGERRLAAFFEGVGDLLGHPVRRDVFACVALGLLGEAPRKSMEPLAAESRTKPSGTSAEHQRIQQFITDSPWEDESVRLYAARYAVLAMTARGEAIKTWIIDDTGFPKSGEHSVGTQRQYSGTLGKIANCQIGVSLSIATDSAHVPIDFELYLPEDWTEDTERREKARIPDAIVFKTKPQLALGMIARAMDAGIPGDTVLTDAGYGNSTEFRDTVRVLGFDYGVGVLNTMRVRGLDTLERRNGEAVSARALAMSLPKSAYRKYTWREGVNKKLSSRFAFRRVEVDPKQKRGTVEREAEWLVIEWPEGEKEPTKYFLTTLGRKLSKRKIVRTIKERYRTEKVYEEMKGELGLDHFEGRRFRGWHHHVTVAICCYAFVVSERIRRFPPSRARSRGADDLACAA